jgi:hypothetical protein
MVLCRDVPVGERKRKRTTKYIEEVEDGYII